MTIINSLGLFTLGIIMRLLPAWAPAFVSPANPDIAAVSPGGLWLLVMSYVIGGIGTACLAKIFLGKIRRSVALWRKQADARETAPAARRLQQARAARMVANRGAML